MKVSKILQALPASLEWLVLVDLRKISRIAEVKTTKEMYFLDQSIDPEQYSHVVLTAIGRFVAPDSGEQLINGESLNAYRKSGPYSISTHRKLLPLPSKRPIVLLSAPIRSIIANQL